MINLSGELENIFFDLRSNSKEWGLWLKIHVPITYKAFFTGCKEGIYLTLSCKICCRFFVAWHVWISLSIYPEIQLGASNSWHRWVLPFTFSQAACAPCPEGLGHKSWWVFPTVPLIQLWLYFRMPSWSAAVPRTSTFPPSFPAPFCLMLDSFRELHYWFLSLQASWYRWSDTQQSCGLCPVACIKNWHSSLAFPGCLASSGAWKIVQVNVSPDCMLFVVF